MAFKLNDALDRNHEKRPPRLFIYGVPGIGKTVFGASAPAPFFIQIEDGLGGLMPDRRPVIEHIYDKGGAVGPIVTSYAEVNEQLTALATEDHEYKTLVVDSVDWLEALVWQQVAAQHKVEHIEKIPYGAGYKEALSVWAGFISAVKYLGVNRGMTVILLSHQEIRKSVNPEVDEYTIHQPKLHPKTTRPILTEWADVVGFANYSVATTSTDTGFGNKRVRAIGTGERLLLCTDKPTHEAKNRFCIPDELPFNWDALAATIPYLASPSQTMTKQEAA